jgi:AcrR family transcriptional regulator
VARNSAALPISDRLLDAAACLLRAGGVEAVSTRAVAAAAGVQPPALYREFDDKDALLDAVTYHVLETYFAKKRALMDFSDSAIDGVRRLWDLHVDFGMTEPEIYALTYGHLREGNLVSAARETTLSLVRDAMARLADLGVLRVSVERAAALFHSCGVGFVLTQLSLAPHERDASLSEVARENALAMILTSAASRRRRSSGNLSARAVALREALRDNPDALLSSAETQLMSEWLNRIADTSDS